MWEMFGMWSGDVWVAVGHYSYVQMHGCAHPAPVLVSEDPDGKYLGWLGTDRSNPTMILKSNVFEIQFPYGSRAEVKAGKGTVLTLDVQVNPAVLKTSDIREFQEWASTDSARWFVLPNGSVFHSRATGHLIPSAHGKVFIETSLEEVSRV